MFVAGVLAIVLLIGLCKAAARRAVGRLTADQLSDLLVKRHGAELKKAEAKRKAEERTALIRKALASADGAPPVPKGSSS